MATTLLLLAALVRSTCLNYDMYMLLFFNDSLFMFCYHVANPAFGSISFHNLVATKLSDNLQLSSNKFAFDRGISRLTYLLLLRSCL